MRVGEHDHGDDRSAKEVREVPEVGRIESHRDGRSAAGQDDRRGA
jgi:hypothetical protein